jgi:hypoxanthine phosphoribosyltransferase
MKKLFDEQQIRQGVAKVASLLGPRYGSEARAAEGPAIFLGVLDGTFMFMADLIREFDQPAEIAFVHAKSYGDRTAREGQFTDILFPPKLDVAGRDVLVVEDIIDTGYTLAALKSHLQTRGARSIELCVFLTKPARRADLNIEADYFAFCVEDEFVVGYGTDYAGKWRYLRDLWILEEGDK